MATFHISATMGEDGKVRDNSSAGLGAALAGRGVFKGAHGLAGLLDAQEFWDKQPYGTRLCYGPGAFDYLHRDVLRAAVAALLGNNER